MKTQMKPMIWLLTLLALLSGPHLASGYYDPGVQRWINRDPIGDNGSLLISTGFLLGRSTRQERWNAVPAAFRRGAGDLRSLSLRLGGRASPWDLKSADNVYEFVQNSPGLFFDPDGRIPIEGPCMMYGHPRSQNPSDGWPCFVACATLVTAGYGALVWVTGGFFGDAGDAMGTIVFGFAACALVCGML
jgi:hypothetical protein